MIDSSSLVLLLSRNDGNMYQMLLILFVPAIVKMIEYWGNILYNKIVMFWNEYRMENRVKYTGMYAIYAGDVNLEFGIVFDAICFTILNTGNLKTIKYLEKTTTSRYGPSDGKIQNGKYILNTCKNLYIEQDLYVDVTTTSAEKKDSHTYTCDTITLTIKSRVKSVQFIKDFVEKSIKEYRNKDKNKTYHFIYQGHDKDKPNFIKNIISDKENPLCKNYETFDFIHNEHKNKIVTELDKLNDLEYYKKHGLKRKKGYLFYGEPGCGKTNTAMAISNRYNRHIIEIPMSRVKKNSHLEEILHTQSICDIVINSNEIIILFDEIDCETSLSREEKNENKEKSEKSEEKKDINTKDILTNLLTRPENPDKLSLGTLLSRLDGIGNYNGIIFIATTNYKDKLDPALYRHGRLDPIYFTFSTREDIKNIIEQFYDKKLTDKQIKKLPDINDKITPSTIKKYVLEYENMGECLRKIGELKVGVIVQK